MEKNVKGDALIGQKMGDFYSRFVRSAAVDKRALSRTLVESSPQIRGFPQACRAKRDLPGASGHLCCCQPYSWPGTATHGRIRGRRATPVPPPRDAITTGSRVGQTRSSHEEAMLSRCTMGLFRSDRYGAEPRLNWVTVSSLVQWQRGLSKLSVLLATAVAGHGHRT
jgi:hypothetical protein